MNKQWFNALLVLPLLMFSCSSGIKPGDKVLFTPENFNEHWKSVNILPGDTLVLRENGSAIGSTFEIRNFRLSVDLYTTNGAEGFVDFHTKPGLSDNIQGYSVKINNSDYRSGSNQKTGSLSLIRNNFVRTAQNNKWFNLVIEVRENNIKTFVNGQLITDYTQAANPERIDGLHNVKTGSGIIRIRKTTDGGALVIGPLEIEYYNDELAVENVPEFADDSLSRKLSLLNQQEFPLIDFHGHLKGGLTAEQVSTHGRLFGYNFGLSPNCGLNFPVTNDSSLVAWYDEMSPMPVFKAMQCEGREWVTLFSPEAIALYDYIFTDAMTWTDHKGRRLRLWIPEETFIDDEQQFMDLLVSKIIAILSSEPVDIYVNPTYLPDEIAGQYNELWTGERMDKVIQVLKQHDIAVEINARFKIPGVEFVKRAKRAGVKFTLGTNNAGNADLGMLEYCVHIIEEAELTPDDMFIPPPAGNKKVMKMGLPSKITG